MQEHDPASVDMQVRRRMFEELESVKELGEEEERLENDYEAFVVPVGFGRGGHRFEEVVGGQEPVQSDPCEGRGTHVVQTVVAELYEGAAMRRGRYHDDWLHAWHAARGRLTLGRCRSRAPSGASSWALVPQ